MEKVDTLVVDKTGTLTEGKPSVTRIVPDGRVRPTTAAAAGCRGRRARLRAPARAGHRHAATDAACAIPDVTDFDSPAGKRRPRHVEGHRVALGSAKFLTSQGHRPQRARRPRPTGCAPTAPPPSSSASTAAAGVFAIADPVKDTTPAALDALRERRASRSSCSPATTGSPPSRRAPARHRPGRGRGAARPQERRRQPARATGPRGRDGRRRRQRRTRPGRRRRRPGDGLRHRRRHRVRRGHPAQGRPDRHRPSPTAVPSDHVEHPAEPGVRVRLQRRRHPHRGRRPLPRRSGCCCPR